MLLTPLPDPAAAPAPAGGAARPPLRDVPPVLRAPPFPGIAAAVAAVSLPAGEPTPDIGAAAGEPHALAAAIRAARVGGSFWAPSPPAMPDAAWILRPRAAADAAAMLREARAAAAADAILMLLPRTVWGRAAARGCRRAGIAAAIGEVDPWPLLRAGNRILAHGEDEWLLLAAIAGASAEARSPGRFASARDEPAAALLRRELIARTCYRDCFTGAPASAQHAIALLAEWRALIDRNRSIAAAAGIAWWKRSEVERFLWVGRERPLRVTRSARVAVATARRAGGAIAVWPSRMPRGLAAAAAAADVPLVRIEDGFVRSVGLGSDLHPPFSVVVDASGLYYDPARPSDLETLLATAAFPPALLARATALADVIVRAGIGKYGVDRRDGSAPAPRERRRVLVAGQVEDDLSVRLGAAGVTGNLDLLRRARAAEPDAELWFRPHPDVDAGHRRGAIPDAEALRHADRVVRGDAMAGLLDRVDAVHVLTSLTGFEALLRGCEVIVHGQPFYAGWGLTRDLAPPIARRGRKLTLPMLVAGALILYPRYLDPVTGLPGGPELLTTRFVDGFAPRPTWLVRVRRVQGRLRRRLGAFAAATRRRRAR